MIDEMFQVDELQQLCGYGLKICDGLEIQQPTVGDIVKLGESEYFNMIYTLTAIPSDMKAQLDQMGIDWEKLKTLNFSACWFARFRCQALLYCLGTSLIFLSLR